MTGRFGFIALLLLLAASPARAQTDYSFYGIADLSYGRFEPSGQYREHRWNSNSLSASFVGVEAKHGFEGGWTPGITLETFIRFEDLDLRPQRQRPVPVAQRLRLAGERLRVDAHRPDAVVPVRADEALQRLRQLDRVLAAHSATSS